MISKFTHKIQEKEKKKNKQKSKKVDKTSLEKSC
jgi:hypothetical protein